jgi:hypothetical protein
MWYYNRFVTTFENISSYLVSFVQRKHGPGVPTIERLLYIITLSHGHSPALTFGESSNVTGYYTLVKKLLTTWLCSGVTHIGTNVVQRGRPGAVSGIHRLIAFTLPLFSGIVLDSLENGVAALNAQDPVSSVGVLWLYCCGESH